MRKIISLCLILTCSGCQKIKSPTNFIGQYGKVSLNTDKESYNQGEIIQIAIQNESASTLFFQCQVPDGGGREYLIMLYQKKQDDNWEKPIGFAYPTGFTVTKKLEPGNRYTDSLCFNVPGIYRFLLPFSLVHQTDRVDTLFSNEFTNNPLLNETDSVSITNNYL